MEIKALYTLFSKHWMVDTDTRKIRKNTIFFALKGENFNGNTFAATALDKGASFSVVDQKEYQTDANIILVDNVLKTLQKLAHYHRVQLGIPIISLTGSNGKTTTKELINTVLKKKFKTQATIGNLNNHIGVPLSLLSIQKSDEIGIIEMGANHQKEIEFLCDIAAPDFGYITNFGKAHLEGFGGIEGVIKGKSELYRYLFKNNKTAFVNPNDLVQIEKTATIKRVLFDFDSIRCTATNPFLKIQLNDLEIQSNLIGTYNFSNIMAAISIGQYFGIKNHLIKEAIEEYYPSNNRSQIIEKKNNTIILDAYNANPTSMKAALESFHALKTNHKKVVILGDMFELGNESRHEHQTTLEVANRLHFDRIILVGTHFYKCETTCLQLKTFDDLKAYISKNQTVHCTFLIKGSRGMALERIVEYIN